MLPVKVYISRRHKDRAQGRGEDMFEHVEVTVHNPVTEQDQLVEFRAFEDGALCRVMGDGSFRDVCRGCSEDENIAQAVKMCRMWYGEVKAVKAF